MNSIKKLVALGLMLAISTSTLVGCGTSKADLETENSVLMEELVAAQEQVEQLQSTLESLTGEESPTSISSIDDGSNAQTFNSLNGKILFPSELTYKDSSQGPNNASINLSKTITIIPSDNWTIQMDGTTTKYSHPNGIYGTIKIGATDRVYKGEEVEPEMLEPFTSTIPYTSIINSKIYLEDVWRGMSSEMTIINNNKPAVIKCGLFGYSDVCLTYMFYYDGDKDNTKTELINNMLKTITVGSLKLRIE